MSISITTSGFTLDGADVLWAEVRAVVTYKRDLFSHDDICLAFRLADGAWVEAS